MRRILLALGVAISACGQAATGEAGGGDTTRVDALGGLLRVPAGFKVDYFARNVAGARFMALGPDGAVYVSQPSSGNVLRLVDQNGDGVAESSVVAISGLTYPHGLAFHKGFLYVANTDGVVRVQLGADGRASGTPQYVNHFSAFGDHPTRTVVFGADIAMYVSIGSTCNLCVETEVGRAGVMRFNEDGSGGRVFATGLRNAEGLAVHSATGKLWAVTNERDNLTPDHENLPPEEIDVLQDGGDYGWPYCHSTRIPNPEYNDAARCAQTIGPALAMQAHSAPLGITFLDRATNFPDDYRADAVVAFHGSWNLSQPTGAKVVRIRIENNAPQRAEDFVTGWQRADGSRWGRPVDVLVHRDGSLLVSDDASGTIYRVFR
jgi:glucose/arabinose dehydrogenase